MEKENVVCIYRYICTHTHTHIHIYMYTHTNTEILFCHKNEILPSVTIRMDLEHIVK